ncbi:MAG: LppM family (lipo)protein [Cumulibacter sp.]
MSSRSTALPISRLAVVFVAVMMVTLSGCLRYTEALTIHRDDTVSGIIIIAARAPDPVSASQAPAIPTDAALQPPQSASEDIVVSSFTHAHEAGYKVTFTHANFADVAAFAPLGEDGGELVLSRDGDMVAVSMSVDLNYDGLDAQGTEYIAKTAELTVSLSVPGSVIDTNGVESGGTITWDLTPFEVNTLTASVHSPRTDASAQGGTRSIDPYWAAVFGGGAVLVAVVGWLLVRRARSAETVTSLSEIRADGARADPVASSGARASRVRPEHQTNLGGWPPPRPQWKEPE